MKRRQFINSIGAGAGLTALGLSAGCATVGGGSKGKVVVIGGGFSGATAAKYIRMWSEGAIAVTLVEPNPMFVSCPISNLVLGGVKQMADITTSYDNLKGRHGIQMVRDTVVAVDTTKRTVTLAGGSTLPYEQGGFV